MARERDIASDTDIYSDRNLSPTGWLRLRRTRSRIPFKQPCHALTTYGIFTHTAIHKEAAVLNRLRKTRILHSDFIFDPDTNVNALKEQIESLTRQLTAEKHRNTQLTLLNELSQQLEAELDPPVAAQLAVNTLERAMDCSFVCSDDTRR